MKKFKFNLIKKVILSSVICTIVSLSFLYKEIKADETTTLPKADYYYSFDDTLAGTNDSNALTYIRTMPYDDASLIHSQEEVSYVEGRVGNAIWFDGNFGLKLDQSFSSESYTISFWMQPENINDYTSVFIATKTTFADENFIAVTESLGFAAPVIWTHEMPSDLRMTTGYNYRLESGTWLYVTIVVDGDTPAETEGYSTAYLYLNGKYETTGSVPAEMLIDTTSYWMGINIWDTIYTGAIDELSFYSTDLNEDQIYTLFTNAGGTKADELEEIIWNIDDYVNDTKDDSSDEEENFEYYETILKSRFNTNGFIHLNVVNIYSNTATSDDDVSNTTPKGNLYLTRAGREFNYFFLFGGLLLIVGTIILLTKYKAKKKRF